MPQIKSEYYVDPTTGQRYKKFIGASIDSSTGEPVDGKSTNGAAHVTTSGEPTTIESIVLTIDGADDLITDPTAPLASELITVVPTTTGIHKRLRVMWLQQSIPYVYGATSDIPWAAYAQVTIEASDDANAISRLTVPNAGVGSQTASGECLSLSAQIQEANFDVSGTSVTIDRVDIGAYPATDAGAIPVYLMVVFF